MDMELDLFDRMLEANDEPRPRGVVRPRVQAVAVAAVVLLAPAARAAAQDACVGIAVPCRPEAGEKPDRPRQGSERSSDESAPESPRPRAAVSEDGPRSQSRGAVLPQEADVIALDEADGSEDAAADADAFVALPSTTPQEHKEPEPASHTKPVDDAECPNQVEKDPDDRASVDRPHDRPADHPVSVDLPEAPDGPDAPELPDLPELPELPEPPEPPESPEPPDEPELPEPPELPEWNLSADDRREGADVSEGDAGTLDLDEILDGDDAEVGDDGDGAEVDGDGVAIGGAGGDGGDAIVDGGGVAIGGDGGDGGGAVVVIGDTVVAISSDGEDGRDAIVIARGSTDPDASTGSRPSSPAPAGGPGSSSRADDLIDELDLSRLTAEIGQYAAQVVEGASWSYEVEPDAGMADLEQIYAQ